MRTLGTRRAVLVAGVATITAAALTACGAGQIAETSVKNPSVYGVNTQNSDRSVLIRGLAVVYRNTEGYPAGSSAPLELNLYNQTRQAITVLVSSQPSAQADEGIVSARQVTLVGEAPSPAGSAIPEPSGSRPAATPDPDVPDTASQPSSSAVQPGASAGPSAQSSASAQPTGAGRPARIEIGPLNNVIFRPGDATVMQATGLTDALMPGMALNLVFEFSNGAEPLVVPAPMAIPLSPASRAPGEPHSPE
jgi:hypothetical protein